MKRDFYSDELKNTRKQISSVKKKKSYLLKHCKFDHKNKKLEILVIHILGL